MSAEQLSSFSVPDVAAGLRYVPGVSVVDGQFAVIRGLDDRYNSTLFNSAPIPSPDPDRQSVQLDLFPSDVVSNLVVSKTFAQDLPSNSSGGSVNILTNGEDYEEPFQLKLSGGTGFNTKVQDRFVEFEHGSPMGKDTNGWGLSKGEFTAAMRGLSELGEREIHYKGVYAWDLDSGTREGTQEGREPRMGSSTVTGGLANGTLDLSNGRFELTDSARTEQNTAYFGLGGGIDEDSNHTLEASVFYTHKRDEAVQLRENGYLPGFDYESLRARQLDDPGYEVQANQEFEGAATPNAWISNKVRPTANGFPSVGAPWFASFADSRSVLRKRDLIVTQLNGDHWVNAIEGLHVTWAGNYARTTQDDESAGAHYFYQPNSIRLPPSFPSTVEQLGPGRFAANDGIYLSANDVEEKQHFGRLDAEYETEVSNSVSLQVRAGAYYEKANRDVKSSYLDSPQVRGSSQFAIQGDTALQLGESLFGSLNQQNGEPAGTLHTTNDAEREIKAWNMGTKATLWEQLDLLGGYRFEKILIESLNDPFTGETAFDGSPRTFPAKWLFFD